MKTMLKTMKTKKSEIPGEVVPVFEEICQAYDGKERDGRFLQAMEQHLTRGQRYWLFDQNGSCKGTGQDGERKAFAQQHAGKPLAERLALYTKTFGRMAVLNEDGTITVTFACHHGYYKHAPKGKFQYPASIETYFEGCAGGRLYEYQKALGIKLRLQSVDITPLDENIANPVVFTFQVVEQ